MADELNTANPITDKGGKMTSVFRTWQNRVSALIPMTGAGDPEGVVAARQFRYFIRTDGASGSLFYVKTVDDVGGDKTMGWVAV